MKGNSEMECVYCKGTLVRKSEELLLTVRWLKSAISLPASCTTGL